MIEEWKPIIYRGIDYTGSYEVSNLGNVRSLDRDIMSKNGFIVHYRGKQLSVFNDTYLGVILSKDGRCRICPIHRLVAIAFLDNPNNFKYVHHKDENKHNNRVDNLEWLSGREHALRHVESDSDRLKFIDAAHEARKHKHWGHSKGIRVRILETNEEFNSIEACSRSVKISSDIIRYMCKGIWNNSRKTDYHFEYVND